MSSLNRRHNEVSLGATVKLLQCDMEVMLRVLETAVHNAWIWIRLLAFDSPQNLQWWEPHELRDRYHNLSTRWWYSLSF